MIREDITGIRIFYQIDKFLREHTDDYSLAEKKLILDNRTWGKTSALVVDILRQVYDELDMLDPDKNIYEGFANLLEENFDINRNIVEIGGGKITSLAKKIALRQTNGTITAYDDKLITTDSNLPNLLLEKRRLQKDESLNADMIIGFMPCDGTQTAIDLAKRNRIDFMIALCEGSCQNDMLAFMEDDWESSMIYEARKAVRDGHLGELKKVKMAKKYQNPYPIIYNQR